MKVLKGSNSRYRPTQYSSSVMFISDNMAFLFSMAMSPYSGPHVSSYENMSYRVYKRVKEAFAFLIEDTEDYIRFKVEVDTLTEAAKLAKCDYAEMYRDNLDRIGVCKVYHSSVELLSRLYPIALQHKANNLLMSTT